MNYTYTYTYIQCLEDFKKAMPFKGEYAFDMYVNEYPSQYPCVLEFADLSNSENGYVYHIEIIHDMSNFRYLDGKLYKKSKSDFIYTDKSLFIEC